MKRHWIFGWAVMLVCASFQTTARADWGAQGLAHLSRLSKSVSTYRNDYLKSIQAAARFRILTSDPSSPQFEKFSVTTLSEFTHPTRRVYFEIARAKTAAAPLVVLFPGVFGSAKEPGVVSEARKLQKLGNHVLILPNPWSKPYREAWPVSAPGDSLSEAKVMLRMIEQAIQSLGDANVLSIQFHGESYGGYLALMTGAELTREEHLSAKLKSVLSVSLPLDLSFTLQRMDSLLDQEEVNYYDRGCEKILTQLFRRLGLAWPLFIRNNPSEISYHHQACSKSIFVYSGFQSDYVSLVKLLNEQLSAQGGAVLPAESDRALRFKLMATLPNARVAAPDELADALIALRLKGVSLKAMIAADDPISEGAQANAPFSKDELVVIPKGGHLGFRADPAYKALLESELGGTDQ